MTHKDKASYGSLPHWKSGEIHFGQSRVIHFGQSQDCPKWIFPDFSALLISLYAKQPCNISLLCNLSLLLKKNVSLWTLPPSPLLIFSGMATFVSSNVSCATPPKPRWIIVGLVCQKDLAISGQIVQCVAGWCSILFTVSCRRVCICRVRYMALDTVVVLGEALEKHTFLPMDEALKLFHCFVTCDCFYLWAWEGEGEGEGEGEEEEERWKERKSEWACVCEQACWCKRTRAREKACKREGVQERRRAREKACTLEKDRVRPRERENERASECIYKKLYIYRYSIRVQQLAYTHIPWYGPYDLKKKRIFMYTLYTYMCIYVYL